MELSCIIDEVRYKDKPSSYEVGKIINRMTIDKMTKLSIDDIKKKILAGKTIRPSYCGGKEKTWKSQQIFMIDIDNKPPKPKGMKDEDYQILCNEYLRDKHRTYNDIIQVCKDINLIPAFIYTSFNHKPDHHKMRLVFILDKEITDINTAMRIQLLFMNSIGEVDEQCKNLNRIFFAGKNVVFDSGNILDSDRLIDLSRDIELGDYLKDSRKGVLHNNEVYNIPLLCSTPKTPNSEIKYYTIKAISDRNIKYLKEKYGNGDKKIFETNQEFIDYIRKDIDLGDFLEFSYPRSIRCIFHNDNSPSASIFQNDEGVWLYKCHSDNCGVTYNIIGVIERLANFQSRPKTYKFIKGIFNLEIMETEWQREQKEILLENLKILYDGEFEKNCPQANKNIKGIKHYLERLILIALDNVHNDNLTDSEGQVVFFASAEYICKQMNISTNSINKIYQKLVVLAYHKLLNKLEDKELPERFLKRAMAINIDNSKNNHVNFFSIPSFTVNNFPDIEQCGRQWKENHYTMKGVSREMFYRAEGLETANKLYPQHKKVTENIDGLNQVVDRTTTKASDARTNNIVKVVHDLIKEYGYAIENAIVERLRSKYSFITTQVQIKKSLKEILDLYGLERIRANSEIKRKFGIISDGYPFIIVKAEFKERKDCTD